MQRVQNAAIRFINTHSNNNQNIEETHKSYNIETINIEIHKRTNKSWVKFIL